MEALWHPNSKSVAYNIQTEEQWADYRAKNNCFHRHNVGHQFVELPHIAEMEMSSLEISPTPDFFPCGSPHHLRVVRNAGGQPLEALLLRLLFSANLAQPVYQDLQHGLPKDGQAGKKADERHVHHGQQQGRRQLGQVDNLVDGWTGHAHSW